MREQALQPAPNNNLLDHARAYISLGWNLVVMKHGTKGPNHVGWNSPGELINTQASAVSKLSNGPVNMGLVHLPSGTCAIDIDDEAWTRHIFDEFGLDMDELLDAGPRILSKSGRAKVLFRAPSDLKLIKIQWPTQNAVRPTDLFTIFELRAGPNQDVLPPSLHPDGHYYEWSDKQAPWDYEQIPSIPDAMLDFWKSLQDGDGRLREEIKALCPWVRPWEVRKIKSANRVASPEHNNIIGEFNRSSDVESLLRDAGYKKRGKRWLAPSSSTKLPGVVVFNDQAVQKVYSHHASDPLGDGFAHDAFDLLTTLVHGGNFNAALNEASQITGVERHKPEHYPDVTIDFASVMSKKVERKQELMTPATVQNKPIEQPPIQAREPIAPPVEEPFPNELLNAPGILGEMMQWMLGCAQKPQPVLALTASLSLVATALAQKVESHSGLRTNLYLVGVGDTSAGKDHGRKCIKLALQAAGLEHMLGGEDIASGQGLMGRVGECPTSLFQPDEFGMLLKAINGKNASSHQTSIIVNLMKLFSSAGTVYPGNEKADRAAKRVDIAYPCVNVHATTTPEPLFDAFGSADITSGNLNRLLILFNPVGTRQKLRFCKATPPPDKITEWIKSARAMQQGQLKGLMPATPISVLMDAKAESMFDDLGEYQQDKEDAKRSIGMSHLWGRLVEHSAKLAVVVACASVDDPDQLRDMASQGQLVVTEKSADWAIKFAKYVISRMEDEVLARVANSDFERITKATRSAILKAGLKGLTHSELARKCSLFDTQDPTKQASVMTSLKLRGDIFMVQYKPPSGRGPGRMAWVSTDFEDLVKGESEEPNA